jgi:zinc transporter ZupT
MVTFLAFKLMSIASILILTVVCGLLPFGLNRSSERTREIILGHFSYLTGGIFLGAGMLHMLPDSVEAYNTVAGPGHHFPTVYLLACIGFLCIWLIDKAGDHHRLVAVAAKSSYRDGGSICYVDVEPVISYQKPTSPMKKPRRQVWRTTSGSLTERLLDTVGMSPNYGSADVEEEGNSALDHSHTHGHGDHNSLASTPERVPKRATSHTLSPTTPAEEYNKHVWQANAPESWRPSISNPAQGCLDHDHVHGHSHEEHDGIPCLGHDHTHGQHAHIEQNEGQHRERGHNCQQVKLPGLSKQMSVHEHDDDAEVFTHTPRVFGAVPADTEMHSGCCASGAGEEGKNLHSHQHTSVKHRHIVFSGSSTLPYILALAFSVHSFIAGLSFGLQHTMDGALAVLIAIFAHKAIEALAVGSNFIREGIRWKTAAPVILTYSLMTPAGEAM